MDRINNTPSYKKIAGVSKTVFKWNYIALHFETKGKCQRWILFSPAFIRTNAYDILFILTVEQNFYDRKLLLKNNIIAFSFRNSYNGFSFALQMIVINSLDMELIWKHWCVSSQSMCTLDVNWVPWSFDNHINLWELLNLNLWVSFHFSLIYSSSFICVLGVWCRWTACKGPFFSDIKLASTVETHSETRGRKERNQSTVFSGV